MQMKVNLSEIGARLFTVQILGYAGTKTEVACLRVSNATTVLYRATHGLIFPSTNIYMHWSLDALPTKLYPYEAQHLSNTFQCSIL